MHIADLSKKDIGALGESVTAEYLRRLGFEIVARNEVRKSGEIDLIASENHILHFVEVKSMVCLEWPAAHRVRGSLSLRSRSQQGSYSPAMNLHEAKIRKVVRTSQWYMATIGWKGEWQVDGALIWFRQADGMAKVQYLPQIV
jgi:Holliday junction resolvase-like predicted endonuclease